MKNLTLPKTLNGLLAVAFGDAKSLNRKLYIPHFAYWPGPTSATAAKSALPDP